MDWLSHIQYINQNYDPDFFLESYKTLQLPNVKVQKITNKNHPARTQYGLFAIKELKQYQILGEYTGVVINKYMNGDYIASFSNISMSLGVNAEKIGNEMRYINHYKNIKNRPNCKFEQTYIQGKPAILIVIIDNIKKDEEILIDYQYDIT